jgi:hypothetical protein
VRVVRDLGRVLNGAPQFMGRPEGELQWQADVRRVWQSRKSGFSACQVLWKIAGRSTSCAAALLPSCARPQRERERERERAPEKKTKKKKEETQE